MKDQDIHEKFIQLRVKNLSFDKISKKLGVCKSTLITWSQDHFKAINNLKSIEQEAMIQKHLIAKNKEFEMVRRDLDRIQKELESRPLDKVSTSKLYELRDRYLEKVKERTEGIRFLGKISDEQLLFETGPKVNPDREWRA